MSYETAAVQKYSALHMMPYVVATTQLWVQLCQIMSLLVVHFQVCWLVAYSSNRFIQRPTLVVIHVSSTLVVGSPANTEDVF